MSQGLNLVKPEHDFQIDPALADDTDLFLDEGYDLATNINQISQAAHQLEVDEATASVLKASLAKATSLDSTSITNQDGTVFINPTVYHAPFSKPMRDENTPFPEHYAFSTRAEFNIWLAGESSWCHYVQRRTTTPAKRAEERMRARLKAHERALAGGFSHTLIQSNPGRVLIFSFLFSSDVGG